MTRFLGIIVASIVGLAAGLGFGILWGWVVVPVEYVDTDPAALRADYKDEYLTLVATAYIADHNLERARQRLAALGSSDTIQSINILAQQLTAEGKDASALITLASDLSAGKPSTNEPPTNTVWNTMEGTGYTLKYPAEWYTFRGPFDTTSSINLQYDLILSDASGNDSPEYPTNDERIRLMVAYVPKPTETLTAWIVRNWAWLNTELTPVTLNGTPALTYISITDDPPMSEVFVWAESGEGYYSIQARSVNTDETQLEKLQTVIISIVFR